MQRSNHEKPGDCAAEGGRDPSQVDRERRRWWSCAGEEKGWWSCAPLLIIALARDGMGVIMRAAIYILRLVIL